MNSPVKKYLFFALFFAFFAFTFTTFMASKPSTKNARVYKTVQKYSPYYLEKRFGGLQIMNKEDKKFKEKPTNATLFQEFERLEKVWGKAHLKLKDNLLIILDNNGTQVFQLPIQTKDEAHFIHQYYGI